MMAARSLVVRLATVRELRSRSPHHLPGVHTNSHIGSLLIHRAPRFAVGPLTLRAASSSARSSGGSSGSVSSSCVRAHKNGQLLLDVFVKPGAKQSAITDLSDGRLHIRVGAAPIDGEANAALLSFLASTLRLRKSTLSVGRGSTSRTKSVVIDAAANDHVSAEELMRRISEAVDRTNKE